MKISTIQIGTVKKMTSNALTFKPERISIDVAEIEQFMPARVPVRLYKSNEVTTSVRNYLKDEAEKQNIIPIFNSREYERYYKMLDTFRRDLADAEITPYRQIEVLNRWVYPDQFEILDSRLRVPYIEIKNGSLVKMKGDRQFRYIVCNKRNIGPRIFECMLHQYPRY